MKSNDEVMILIKIRELKEENMKLKDKVEGLQDRIDNAINYIYDHYDLGTEEEVSFCILRDRVLERLKGDNK